VSQLPATFALRNCTGQDSSDVCEELLAIGMTLPDGSAVTIDWRGGRAGTVGVWSSAHAAAGAYDADLLWYGRGAVTAALGGPPNGALRRFAA